MRRPSRVLVSTAFALALLVGAAAPADAAAGATATTATTTTTSSTTAAATAATTCAEAVTTGYTLPASPSAGPCWVDVQPYPFGSYIGPSGNEEAGPVEIENEGWRKEHESCLPNHPNPFGHEPVEDECFLTVTSMAFRSWNHGLAATYPTAIPNTETSRANNNPYGVWIYNGNIESGQQWYPDPTFPGHVACPGHRIVWAGKLDYWLIGGPTDEGWHRLCRYDGFTDQWQEFSVPAATIRHVTPPTIPPVPAASRARAGAPTPAAVVGPIENPPPNPGGMTTAACLAWNDCWFFGTYGVVVHWNGVSLSDASPSTSEAWLNGEYLAAATSEDPVGDPFAVVVGGTAQRRSPEAEGELIPGRLEAAPRVGGVAPTQMFRSVPGVQVVNGVEMPYPEFTFGVLGGSSALPFEVPTEGQASNPASGWLDPFRTDLVAVGFDEAGQGWVAGNPAGLRAAYNCSGACQEPANRRIAGSHALAPLVPVDLAGEPAKCTEARFGPETLSFWRSGTPEAPGSFLWSSLAVLPGSGDALAGGLVRPPAGEGAGPNETGESEPVIVRAGCDGSMTTTRFRVTQPPFPGEATERVPADRRASVTAIVASAANDAWATTTEGTLERPNGPINSPTARQPPHLYHFTDGQRPSAPEGDELEERFEERQENPPIYVFELEPEQPQPPAPPPVTSTQTTHELPSLYGIKAKVRRHGDKFALYLSFKLRRPITIGAEGLRHGRVVARARPRRFSGSRGVLVLALNRKHWPTKISFTS